MINFLLTINSPSEIYDYLQVPSRAQKRRRPVAFFFFFFFFGGGAQVRFVRELLCKGVATRRVQRLKALVVLSLA